LHLVSEFGASNKGINLTRKRLGYSDSASLARYAQHVRANMPQSESTLHRRLIETAIATPWLLDALDAVAGLGLPEWCIGAGAVRAMVWDSIDASSTQVRAPGDVDVAYFDARDTGRRRDSELQARLESMRPGLTWDVTNQAGVHEWYPGYFGSPFAPLASLEEAVGSWPEYATCVGLRLRDDGSIEVIAPYGLQDLYGMVIRHNPARASVESYRARLVHKRYAARWPGVTVVPG